MTSSRRAFLLAALLLGALAGCSTTAAATTTTPVPTLIHDVRTGFDTLGSLTPASSLADYVQPDTQIEPSIAVNPSNPRDVVTAYQEGRIDSGGDATNGYATSFDGGQTWKYGELPGLTHYPGQTGEFERASDAVVAFGPNNTVYANSLVFDQNEDNGLRSGIAVNVSKDGGRTWSKPVVFQDDQLGGTNDKNWIVVDNSSAPGHHKGRVYVVWDRVAPVVYNYCDHDCDQQSNWLPNMQTVPGLVFAGQGIGAFPLVLKDGGLGIVMETLSGGIPTGIDEPIPQPGDDQVLVTAPEAGSTPFPAPLTFAPPIDIGENQSAGTPAQRASGGLPAAAVDPKSGALYAVWDDGRFRTDGTNDAVLSRSTDNGLHWSPVQRINTGSKTDHVDHYNVTIATAGDGVVRVAWRQRNETGKSPNFTPNIDTYYVESRNGGKTFTAPLRVDRVASNAFYDALSRAGSFEGDYNQTASAGGYTYIVRAQGQPAYKNEPRPLVGDGNGGLKLTQAGKGHQHQSVWVALVQDLRR